MLAWVVLELGPLLNQGWHDRKRRLAGLKVIWSFRISDSPAGIRLLDPYFYLDVNKSNKFFPEWRYIIYTVLQCRKTQLNST